MKAVLVLCEGRHEIVFVQRSLGAVAGCRWMTGSIKELPSPFGTIPGTSAKGLVARRIERNVRAVEDLTLWSIAHPQPPQYQHPVFDGRTDTIFLPVSTNGKKQVSAVVDFLEDVDAAMDVGGFAISEYAAAFLFDADTVGLTATLEEFLGDYSGHFGDLSDTAHSQWVVTAKCPVGVFVFHRTAEDETGTLEDHLAPMVSAEWPDRYASACDFIDGNKRPGDEVSRSDARRLKAIITSAGQFYRPGLPLSSMIARDGIPNAQFAASRTSRDLVAFLQGVPWRVDPPSGEPGDGHRLP